MNYQILINKDNPLSEKLNFNLVEIESDYKKGIFLEEKTYEQFLKLKEEALKYNYKIDVMSGYRSHEYQEKLFNEITKKKGFAYANTHVAKPNTSEHESGLAIDFCIYKDDSCYIEYDIMDMEEVKWIHQNAHRFGFILRYPFGKEDITKYSYEPWHLRYVGNIASDIYNKNLTLEEYLA